MKSKPDYRVFIIKIISFLIFFSITNFTYSQTDWMESESDNFKVIYRKDHSYLVPKIFLYAEDALKTLQKLFHYNPSEKIVINTFDASDFGFGATTTVPKNYIRLEIAPMEPGYEAVPFDNRLKWIISHELVHIVVNDDASNFEKLFRNIFGKVMPEQIQPQTILYSLLTSFNRYSPRWHQESIAVFFETWLNGGFGRTLGSFDEMYFRSLIYEEESFASEIELDTKVSQTSYLLENIFYLYGNRFASYLVLNFGPEKLIQWFETSDGEFYKNFESKFKSIYETDLTKSWNDFILFEKNFQELNLQKLQKYQLTQTNYISPETYGWVTQPYVDKSSSNIIFAFHRAHQLAQIQSLNLKNGTSKQIISLPTPSIIQVASTAYDPNTNLFFYTTNNNQLYRDIWVLDVEQQKTKMLFENCRVGSLTVSPVTHELWGLEHSSGLVSIVYSPYPYHNLNKLFQFNFGEEIQQLAVSPSGERLAAVIHHSNGEQKIILLNTDSLKNNGELIYSTVYENGSPENVSWSNDEQYIYWNAYTSGVSNIYRMQMSTQRVEAISHTLRGLFRPLYLNQDYIFAFEFTSKGFIPVVISNKPVEYVPAINYLGQRILDKYPNLLELTLSSDVKTKTDTITDRKYIGFNNLELNTLIPVISGFQSQKVLGIFGRISDPMLTHDIRFEVGYSPFKEKGLTPKFHLKLKYEYEKQFELGIDYNATEFYDLFNKRKRGLNGTKLSFGYNHYWIYDNPLKMKQFFNLDIYSGIEFLNDNLVKVSQSDFLVAQSFIEYKNQRRSIGSIDFEQGSEADATLMVFHSNTPKSNFAFQAWLKFGQFFTWLIPHNIFYVQAAAGYHKPNSELQQAGFFFGGFGNREFEYEKSKQYREVFRFPGIPIYSLKADNFFKLMLENNFPPVRLSDLSLGRHYLSYIDFSVFTQAMNVKTEQSKYWVNGGGQVNFIFKHWDNLESTLSIGVAKAWFDKGNDWEWFLSFKLLKN